jgi:hypothetical protein
MILSLLASLTLAEAADLRRLALVVGANDGGASRTTLRYAGRDASGFASVLSQLGGVPASDLTLLIEPKADQIRVALDELDRRATQAQRAGDRVEVVVYYSGHSDQTGLLAGGELLPYDELRTRIADIGADVRITVLDSCASGAMIRTKGGVMRPPFLFDVGTDVEGEAWLTSSTATEASQESDRIQASFFTHHLVAGLRGAADADRDGRVTLNEAYSYAFRETRRSTESTLAGAQHPNYALDLSGQGDLILTDLRDVGGFLVLDEDVDGLVWVQDAAGQMVAEVEKLPGSDLALSLPEGTYKLSLQGRPQVLHAQIDLHGGEARVHAGAFSTAEPRQLTVSRGGSEVPATPDAPEALPDAALAAPTRPSVAFGAQFVPGVGTALPNRDVGVGLGVLQSTWHDVNGAQISSLSSIATGDVRGAQLSALVNVAGGSVRGFQGAGLVNVGGGTQRGAQVAGLVNVSGGGHEVQPGVQLAGLINVSGGSRVGGQGAGLINITGRHLHGTQLAGIGNVAGGEVRGTQAASMFNVSGGDLRGVQLSSGFNRARELRGAQLGLLNISSTGTHAQLGLLNITGRTKGAQIGLLNIAKELDGEAVGLLSIIGNGYHAVSLTADDIELVGVDLRLGSRHVYNLVHLGHDLFTGQSSIGLGIGVHAPLGPVYFDVELLARSIARLPLTNNPSLTTSLRPMVGVRLFNRLQLFGGPAVHATYSFGDANDRVSALPTWQVARRTTVGVGLQAGVGVTF